VKIGFRTLKTAIGVSLSTFLASAVGLEFFTAAGILTLLCIQKTRKKSFQAIIQRLFACLLGLAASSVMFSVAGVHPLNIFLLFILFIPLLVLLRIQAGIASSSVIIMHTYVQDSIQTAFLVNELGIIFVGLSTAFLLNMYMPGIDKTLAKYKEDINRNFAVVLKEFARYLKEGDGLWDGKEMLVLQKLLDEARNLSIYVEENNFSRKKNGCREEFDRKLLQFQVMERMLPIVSRINVKLEQGERFAEFLNMLALHIDDTQDPSLYTEKLRSIREYHKRLPMPVTREEFETRANLFSLANELEILIRI